MIAYLIISYFAYHTVKYEHRAEFKKRPLSLKEHLMYGGSGNSMTIGTNNTLRFYISKDTIINRPIERKIVVQVSRDQLLNIDSSWKASFDSTFIGK